MTLATMTIHTEAWLQEELGAQQALLAGLARVEDAARTGSGADLQQRGAELQTLLARSGAREARRQHLLEKLARAMKLEVEEVTLTKLIARLAAAGIDAQRLERSRAELREAVQAVGATSRRLAAMAQYHRGVLEELCQALVAGAPRGAGHLVDARG